MRNIHLLLILIALTLSGCNNSPAEGKRPYLMQTTPPTKSTATPITQSEEKIALTAMEAAHQEKLASIKAQKEMTLKKLELEREKIAQETKQKISLSENQTQQTISITQSQAKQVIEKERQKSAILIEQERSTLYQQYLTAAVILFLVLMIMLYAMHRKKHALKLKLHEEELRHKEYMQASKQHHERVSKTLEILASESTDKHLKKELVKLLKDQGGEQPKLLN